MAELKTKKTTASLADFLAAVDGDRRKDCETIVRLMKKATKAAPALWGSSIVGFGTSSYRTADGKEHPWFVMGFSPRKANLALYLGARAYPAILKKLGKHKLGGGCLYVNRLADVDVKVLEELIDASATARGR
jgi:hypothetical protein